MADEGTPVVNTGLERVLHLLVENIMDMVLVVDRAGLIHLTLQSAKRILGYEPVEMIGHNAVEFISPLDLDAIRLEMGLIRRDKEPRRSDCRYIHKNGAVVPLYWTGIWSEDAQLYLFVGMSMTGTLSEIEKLTAIEVALQELDRRLRLNNRRRVSVILETALLLLHSVAAGILWVARRVIRK